MNLIDELKKTFFLFAAKKLDRAKENKVILTRRINIKLYLLLCLFSFSYSMEPTKKLSLFNLFRKSNNNNKSENLDKCSICLESLPREWPKLFTMCYYDNGCHSFCSDCIYKSLLSPNLKCPLCMRSIPKGDIWEILINKTSLESQKKRIDITSKEAIQFIIKSGRNELNKAENELDTLRNELDTLKNKLNNSIIIDKNNAIRMYYEFINVLKEGL